MASSFFWVWKEISQGGWCCFDHDDASGSYSERVATKRALAHVRPSRIAGFPISFAFDRSSGRFTMRFHADPGVRGPHVIVVPEVLGPPLAVRCDERNVTPNIDGTSVSISCGDADDRDHELAVDFAP